MSNIQPLPFRRPGILNYIDAVDEVFDVAIIGGGATGVYTALEAASRGYRTVLFERGDFASGTSSRSTKLIHGGVRYMQQGRFRMVRESVRERRLFIDNAPHLVRSLPVFVPAYSQWQRLKYTAGVMGYDAVARGHRLRGTRRLGVEQAVEAVPGIRTERLRGGAVYHDGQTDDARLALAIAQTAAAHGAAMLNYVEAKELIIEAGRISGVVAQDLLTGEEVRVRARVVVNATGIYTDETLKFDPGGPSGLMRWSRGTHVVLSGSVLPGGHGLLIPSTSDGRVIFALPWLGSTLVGTTDVPVDDPDAAQSPPGDEVAFLIEEISEYLPGAADSKVLSAFSGIRPLVSNDAASKTASLSRSHRVLVSGSGLVTVTGGKWTTARLMAQHTVDRAAEVAGLPASKTATPSLRLEGYDAVARDTELFRTPLTDPDLLYGAKLAAIASLEKQHPELKAPLADDLPYRLSHAVYAVKEEMAQTLEDVLARRTRSMFLDIDASMGAVRKVADAIEEHAGVQPGWAQSQVAALEAQATAFRPSS